MKKNNKKYINTIAYHLSFMLALSLWMRSAQASTESDTPIIVQSLPVLPISSLADQESELQLIDEVIDNFHWQADDTIFDFTVPENNLIDVDNGLSGLLINPFDQRLEDALVNSSPVINTTTLDIDEIGERPVIAPIESEDSGPSGIMIGVFAVSGIIGIGLGLGDDGDNSNPSLPIIPPASFILLDQPEFLSSDVLSRNAINPDTIVAAEMEITMVNGVAPSGDTVQLFVGDTIEITVHFADISDDFDVSGAFSGYADLLYEPEFFNTLDIDDFVFLAPFTAGQSGDSSSPGLINEIGAVSSPGATATDQTAYFTFEVELQRATNGFEPTVIKLNPADLLPLHEITIFDPPMSIAPSNISYGELDLFINA